MKVSLTASVNIDKTINELKEILEDVSELQDLVPEWNNIEAEQLTDSIYKRLSKLIEVKNDN